MHLIMCFKSGFCCVQERHFRLVPTDGELSTCSSLGLSLCQTQSSLTQMPGSLKSPLQAQWSAATLLISRCWLLLMGNVCPQLPPLVAVLCWRGCPPQPS